MSQWFLAVIALLPLVWLLAALGWFKLPAIRAGLIGLILSCVAAVWVFRFSAIHAVQAVAEGAVLAFWPILWAIIGAIFAYNVGVETGNIEKIKAMLAGISGDRRIQVLIMAWAFSGFMEGAAGYGTAVAIPASILIALGFEPVFAAVICLIGNTAPTAFGAIGIPVITLAKVAEVDLAKVSVNVSIQLTLLMLIIPVVMVWLTSKKGEGLKGVWGVTLVAGISFAIVHYATAKWLGPELPALLGGIASLTAIIGWLKLTKKNHSAPHENQARIGLKGAVTAWAPYIILFGLIILTSSLNPGMNHILETVQTKLYLYRGKGGNPMVIHWLLTPGSLIFVSAVIGGLIQGASIVRLMKTFGKTVKKLVNTIITVIGIVAIAKVMSYSGMIAQIANVLAGLAGPFYPLLAPALGAIGTFVTGSDTSSNILFGQVQKQTALRLGADPAWLAAANTAGATAGKMISPQNIAIATSAANLPGKEGVVLEGVWKACFVYVVLLGLIIYFAPRFF